MPHHTRSPRIRRHNEYMAALHETTLGLVNRLDLADLLETVVNRATQLVNASFGWIYLVDPDTDTLELKIGTGALKRYIGTRVHRDEGLSGRVWQSGQPLVVDDYPSWAGHSLQYPWDLTQSAIGVPLRSGTQIVGALGVMQNDPTQKLGKDEEEILSRFAQLASVALDNARLYADLQQELAERQRVAEALAASEAEIRSLLTDAQRRARELGLLDKVRTALSRELDLMAIFQTVVEAIAHTFGYTQVGLYVLQGDVLHLAHQVGYDSPIDDMPISMGVMGRTVRSRQPVLIEDVRSDPDFVGMIPGIVSEICVPLFDQDRVFGTLNVESVGDVRLTEADLRLIQVLGQHVNIAIQRARLYTEARQNEQKYRSVVENVLEVIFQADETGAWTYLNPAWTQITGFAVADTVGKPIVDFVCLDDRPRVAKGLQRMMSGARGSSNNCEVRYLTADGGYRWLETRCWPLLAPDGRIAGVSGVLNDITERKRVLEELQDQRDFALYVMNTMGQGLTITGPDGKWEYVNPAYAEMLGYPPETLIGREPEEFTFAEDIPFLERAHADRMAGLTTTYETRLHSPSGTVYALITGAPRRHDIQIIGSIAVITDLTKRKQIENALASARDQALEASRLKSEFLATMSHEIRTPMNSILGMNDLLLSTHLSDEQREYAEAVQISAEGLLSIIDDILDFSRIEAGKLTLVEVDFDLRKVVENVCDMFAAKARAKGVAFVATVTPELPMGVRGDPGRLRQVLVNLIGNAVKFTDRGEIRVTANMVSGTEAGCILRFEVSDTGIGIPLPAHQRIFELFMQVDGSMSRRYSGTGLGLAISKRLVELMGGEIGFKSAEGAGAQFWFTVVVRPAAADPATLQAKAAREAAQSIQPTTPASGGVRVLLVEDNSVNQRLATLQLERLGYAVRAVADGHQAVKALVDAPDTHDLVLMDCQMPTMDGFEATNLIRRAEPAGRHIPIIAMTANAMRGDREACLAAGMDDYISKPIRLMELDQVIRRWHTPLPQSASEPAAESPQSELTAVEQRCEDEALDPTLIADLLEVTTAGGPEAFIDLIDTFLSKVTDHIAGIREAIAVGDAAALSRLAHTLKGSSGSYGARQLSAAARELEMISKGGSTEGASELLEQLETEFERAKCAFIALREQQERQS